MSAGDARKRLEQALADHGCSVRGNAAQCPGPGHSNGDRNASLSIAQGREGAVLNCHLGCETDVILEALGMSSADLFDEPHETRERRRVVAEYDYTDEAGQLLFRKVRYDPKDFRQYRIVNGRQVWTLGDARRVLYRLPQVLEAVRSGHVVYLAEGEKDVHALELAGVTATCNFDGAAREGQRPKWRPAYGDMLKGADVVIVADRDGPGLAHAAAAAADLAGKAKSVRVVEAAQGKDAADHLAAGRVLEDFRPVADSVSDIPDGSDSDAGAPAALAVKYVPVDWQAAWNGQPDAVDWLIEPVLEAGTVNSLFALPGTGKSLLALEWALRLVRDGRTVVYVDDENRLSDIVERLQAFGAEPVELGRLLLYSFAGLPPLDTMAGGVDLLALALAAGAALVVLDTTSRMVAGKENDSDTFLALYRFAMRPLKSRGITVLRLDHPGKDAERGQRGSSAKDGDVDTIWLLKETVRGKRYLLECRKSRSGHSNADVLEVTREYAPVRHVWPVRTGGPKMTPLGQLCGQLHRLSVLPSAGRTACRNALAEAGISASNELLTAVVKHRKTDGCDCPPEWRTAADSSDSGSPGRQLSEVPPLSIERDSGQVSGDQSAGSGELWPEGSHGEAAR